MDLTFGFSSDDPLSKKMKLETSSTYTASENESDDSNPQPQSKPSTSSCIGEKSKSASPTKESVSKVLTFDEEALVSEKTASEIFNPTVNSMYRINNELVLNSQNESTYLEGPLGPERG